MDQIAHALHVDHRPVGAGFVEQTLQLCDHVLFLAQRPAKFQWFGRVIVIARSRQATRQSSACTAAATAARSEEHTSELQSLMRISYAVFCLKKKKNKNTYPSHLHLHKDLALRKTHTDHTYHDKSNID